MLIVNKLCLFRAIIPLIMCLAASVQASSLYNYIGNAFEAFSSPSSWDGTMNMSVTFELSDTLDPNLSFSSISPVSFSFSDGVNTITDEDVAANPTLYDITFEFSTDSSGVITDWHVVAEHGPGLLENMGDNLVRIFTASSGSTPKDIGIIFTCISINPDGSCSTAGDWASSLPDNPGTWTVSEAPINAGPVEILLTGILSANGSDSDNLDGSSIRVSYQADSTDLPLPGGGGPFSHTNIFDFNVSIDITSRPGGHVDLSGEWPDIPIHMVNNFSLSGENDGARFTRVGGGGILPGVPLYVDSWDIDFGADSIFPDRDELPMSPYPPEDLSFLFNLEQDFTKHVTRTPEVFTSTDGLTFYSINNLTVTNVYGIPGIPVPDGDINNDGQVNVADLLLALRILNNQYTPSLEEQARWDVSPLVSGVPEPDQQNNLGDYLILQRKVLGNISF